MMKYFLLVAGEQYYPDRGAGDWIECFESYEDAQMNVLKLEDDSRHNYIINTPEGSRKYDWYEIINLKDWVGKGVGERWGY